MTFDKNPFPSGDADRHALWEMLVRRDIDAFIGQDWSMVENDFVAESFFGMHAHFLANADAWRLQFPRLEIYRDEWLRQAKETAATKFAEPLREALFRVTNLRDIDVAQIGDAKQRLAQRLGEFGRRRLLGLAQPLVAIDFQPGELQPPGIGVGQEMRVHAKEAFGDEVVLDHGPVLADEGVDVAPHQHLPQRVAVGVA